MVYENILQTIGDTPLVRLNASGIRDGIEIFAKIEGANPTGSIKDRAALKMIEQAEAAGILTPDKTILEPTSGNTGISLAMIGAVKGYAVEIVMSRAASRERVQMIEAFGASVTLTHAEKGTDGAIAKAREMAAASRETYYMPDQFSNSHNYGAHYKTTANEIWKQANGNIDYFVSAVGTSGTLMGVGRALKENDPRIQIIEAHPVRGHYIQGLKNMEEAVVPAIYDRSLIDHSVMVETNQAYTAARKIVRYEGVFAGMSSGAALHAALTAAQHIEKGRIVVIFPDRGEKYLSTNLFA